MKLEKYLLEITESKFVDDLLNKVCQECFLSCVKHKKDNKIKKNKSTFENLFGEVFENVFSFKFIDDLVCNARFDRDLIKETVENYIKEQKEMAKLKDDPYNFLEQWWDKEDAVIDGNIKELKAKLSNNEYAFIIYPDILKRLISLNFLGLNGLNLDEIERMMTSNIQSAKEFVYYAQSEIYSGAKADEYELYKTIVSRITDVVNEVNGRNRTHKINDILKSLNWSEKFRDYCNTFQERDFFLHIDINLLLENVEKGNSLDIVNCRDGISRIYRYSEIKETFKYDLKNLREFFDLLMGSDESNYGKIKQFNIDCLKELLKSKIVMLSREN